MKLGPGVLIALGVAVIAGATTLRFFNGPTKEYRACVALMWDQKHPVEARQRYAELAARKCEKDRLSGANPLCDPEAIINTCERFAENTYRFDWETCVKDSIFNVPDPDAPPENPCQHLSLEKLRRADADASRDKP